MNSRFRSPWKVLLLVLALACMPLRAQLPSLGDAGDLTLGAERKMGEQVARELYRDPDYLDDPIIDEYVLGIWNKLLDAARARGELTPELDSRFAWQVVLGKDREINAFALPGGWMGLNLGLISATSSRDEVAAVLGHELSHVTQRHIARLMAEQQRATPMVIGAMILGALAISKNPDAGGAVFTGGQALAMQNQLNFSRDMEREADRVGFGVMTQAGYDPQAFATMFEKLQQASRLNDNGEYPYLRTHPMTTERIAEIRSRLQLVDREPAREPDLVHMLMAGRARVMEEPGVDVLRSYVREDALHQGNRARQAGALYSAALASVKLRDMPGAAKFARRLEELTSGNPAAARETSLLEAEVALAAGDLSRAAALDPAAGRPELVLNSQAKIRSGGAADVAQRLQTWVAVHPRDAQAWQLLSQAYGAQNRTLLAVRADAETQVAHLDYQAALDRFRAAQDMARRGVTPADHIEASIIDARAREVQSLLREQTSKR